MDETGERVTPIKLWPKVKVISYDNEYFINKGRMMLSKALGNNIKLNELIEMIYIQQSVSEFVEKNEDIRVYSFMKVAKSNVLDYLEKVYQLALLDTRITYEYAERHSRNKRKNASFVFIVYTFTIYKLVTVI